MWPRESGVLGPARASPLSVGTKTLAICRERSFLLRKVEERPDRLANSPQAFPFSRPCREPCRRLRRRRPRRALRRVAGTG